MLCALTAEVLGLSAVAPEENFFELGGDSIVSIRLVSLARKAGLTISARQIFQHPTPAALAAVAMERDTAPAAAPRPSDGGPGPLPLPRSRSGSPNAAAPSPRSARPGSSLCPPERSTHTWWPPSRRSWTGTTRCAWR
ncbi:phosphopantetheine-binding protein [Streptomyces goshikiensis]